MSSAAALSGALFACGLALGGMTEPARVLGFLDLAGAWDPTLAFVMAGALLVYSLLYRLITRKLTRPLLSDAFHVPPRGRLDAKLWLGAALFGVGWGLSGLCPGPAVVALGAGKGEALLFMVCMLAGAAAASLLTPRLSAQQAAAPEALARDDA